MSKSAEIDSSIFLPAQGLPGSPEPEQTGGSSNESFGDFLAAAKNSIQSNGEAIKDISDQKLMLLEDVDADDIQISFTVTERLSLAYNTIKNNGFRPVAAGPLQNTEEPLSGPPNAQAVLAETEVLPGGSQTRQNLHMPSIQYQSQPDLLQESATDSTLPVLLKTQLSNQSQHGQGQIILRKSDTADSQVKGLSELPGLDGPALSMAELKRTKLSRQDSRLQNIFAASDQHGSGINTENIRSSIVLEGDVAGEQNQRQIHPHLSTSAKATEPTRIVQYSADKLQIAGVTADLQRQGLPASSPEAENPASKEAVPAPLANPAEPDTVPFKTIAAGDNSDSEIQVIPDTRQINHVQMNPDQAVVHPPAPHGEQFADKYQAQLRSPEFYSGNNIESLGQAGAVSVQSAHPRVDSPVNIGNEPISAAPSLSFRSTGWDRHLGSHIAIMLKEDVHSATINVKPAELGPLNIQLSIQSDQLNVTISASQALTRETLEASLPRLRDQFSTLGFSQVDVNVGDRGEAGNRESASGGDKDNPYNGNMAESAARESEVDTWRNPPLSRHSGLLDTFA